MSNPIPSVMVYFDEKQRRAVLCVDKSLPPPAVVEACTNMDDRGLHTHTWTPLGWMTESVFMHGYHRPREAAARFVQEMMKGVIEYRDLYDRMEHELHVVRKQNTNLENTVRQMTGCLKHAVTMLDSEAERLVLLKMISNAQRNTMPHEEPDQPEA